MPRASLVYLREQDGWGGVGWSSLGQVVVVRVEKRKAAGQWKRERERPREREG